MESDAATPRRRPATATYSLSMGEPDKHKYILGVYAGPSAKEWPHSDVQIAETWS